MPYTRPTPSAEVLEERRKKNSKYATDWNKRNKEIHAQRCKAWRDRNPEVMKMHKENYRLKMKFKRWYAKAAKDAAITGALRAVDSNVKV